MAGVKKLRKIQIGKETTAGTAVAATTILRGPGTGIEALDDIQFVDEDIGNYGDANRTVKVSQGAQCAIAEQVLTFEQFPYLLEMGVMTASPAADTGGSGYVYTYTFPTTAEPTIATYTVEAGNNQKVYEMEYSICPEFSVRGEPDAAVRMSGMLRGRQRTATTFTAALSVPDVDSAVFDLSKLYADTAGGTMGTTQLAGVFYGFSVNVRTGIVPVTTGDGQLYFYTEQQVGWEVTADVVFRHIAAADTEDANWLAQTARLLEIKCEGATLQTAGANYSLKTVEFQLPGKWQKFSTLEDREGNDILTGTFVSKYDPTAAIGPVIVVVNELSALT